MASANHDKVIVFTRPARPRRHVAVRTVATYALSIVGDHCDVTATRPTGGRCRLTGRWHKAYHLALVAWARLGAAWPG
jgi:hypothetical protein